MRTTLSEKLAAVRKLTGKRFSAAKGYDLRKPMSKARGRTIARYYDAILELTSRPHVMFRPKRGTKKETFEYTQQKHLPRFEVAILHTPDEKAKYSWSIDKQRPKGSRFTVLNKRTRQRSWHIPARVFIDDNPYLVDSDEDVPPEYLAQIIEEYGHEAEMWMIEAGESHMWGDSGNPEQVGKKLSELFRNYGSQYFDPYDKNSHHIKNWFGGVQAFTQADAITYARRQLPRAKAREEKWGLPVGQHVRQLKSGDIGLFYRGKIVHIFTQAELRGSKVVATPEYGVINVDNDDTS